MYWRQPTKDLSNPVQTRVIYPWYPGFFAEVDTIEENPADRDIEPLFPIQQKIIQIYRLGQSFISILANS